jgi:flagellar hook-associated protein 1 FlgK
MVNDADNARKAVSGVSLDEELANIIKFQYAYTGASRMLTVLDEMTEVIQNLV